MYKLKLALRYLFNRRITYLAVAAVAVCVFIVVVVVSVHNGIVEEFRKKNHDYVGDCVVGTESLVGFPYYKEFIEILENTDFVYAATAVVKSFGLVTPAGSDRSIGVPITGIVAQKHAEVTGFAESLHYNSENPGRVFDAPYQLSAAGFAAGIGMMAERTQRGEYDLPPEPQPMEVVISCFPLTAKGALRKAGTDAVNTKSFFFSDTVQTNLAKVDGQMIYLPFEHAQLLTGMDWPLERASAIYIKCVENADLNQCRGRIAAMWAKFVQSHEDSPQANLLSNVTVQTWKQNRRAIIAPMEKEQIMLILLFLLVGFKTAFVIFVVFYMLINHKSRDIGILRSVGVSAGNVLSLFLLFAILIGVFASLIGATAGVIFVSNAESIENYLYENIGWQVWDRSVYAIGKIPSEVRVMIVVVIVAAAMVTCILGGLVPTINTARKRPVDALRVSGIQK